MISIGEERRPKAEPGESLHVEWEVRSMQGPKKFNGAGRNGDSGCPYKEEALAECHREVLEDRRGAGNAGRLQ